MLDRRKVIKLSNSSTVADLMGQDNNVDDLSPPLLNMTPHTLNLPQILKS